MFAEMRRALLLRADKAHFDELWNKAEFHVPAAEKAKHPLPVTSILLCMNLEQEKAIYQLEGKVLAGNQRIHALEETIEACEIKIERLHREIDEFKSDLRQELLEIIYPSYVQHVP